MDAADGTHPPDCVAIAAVVVGRLGLSLVKVLTATVEELAAHWREGAMSDQLRKVIREKLKTWALVVAVLTSFLILKS